VLVSTGLARSNSEARRLKESGAVYINSEKADKDHLDASDFRNGKLLIRRGKAFKDSALIELV
jgi:tyrosyl-tRNA synthetase